jgi:hypothetical protein
MAQQDQHEQSLADGDNEGGAMSSKREIPELDERHVTRIQQRDAHELRPRFHSRAFDPRTHCGDDLSARAG